MAHYSKALNLNPDIDWVLGDLVHMKMKLCLWDNLSYELDSILQKLLSRQKSIRPFPLLSLVDNSQVHKSCSEIYAQALYPLNPSLGPIMKSTRGDKIRIGYFSPDLSYEEVTKRAVEFASYTGLNNVTGTPAI